MAFIRQPGTKNRIKAPAPGPANTVNQLVRPELRAGPTTVGAIPSSAAPTARAPVENRVESLMGAQTGGVGAKIEPSAPSPLDVNALYADIMGTVDQGFDEAKGAHEASWQNIHDTLQAQNALKQRQVMAANAAGGRSWAGGAIGAFVNQAMMGQQALGGAKATHEAGLRDIAMDALRTKTQLGTSKIGDLIAQDAASREQSRWEKTFETDEERYQKGEKKDDMEKIGVLYVEEPQAVYNMALGGNQTAIEFMEGRVGSDWASKGPGVVTDPAKQFKQNKEATIKSELNKFLPKWLDLYSNIGGYDPGFVDWMRERLLKKMQGAETFEEMKAVLDDQWAETRNKVVMGVRT